MPPAPRPSVGARRKDRAHIPFRADELGRGKKTGAPITYVDHRSDEFEPFEQIMSQADARTPPNRGRRRSTLNGNATPRGRGRGMAALEEDGEGEMSMEIDDYDPPASTHVSLANARGAPSSNPRRTVPRVSDVDYDALPSPPPASLRRSSAYTHASASAFDFPEQDFDMDPGGTYDDDDVDDERYGYRYPPAAASASRAPGTPRRTSFAQIAEEDEDEEEEEVEDEVEAMAREARQRAKGKGKARAVPEDEDDGAVEDEIAQGLDEVGMDVDMDGEDGYGYEEEGDDGGGGQEQEPASPPRKEKKRGRPPKRNGVISASQLSPAREANIDGLRRGTRMRYKPLEWWRRERVVYGRRESGISLVPTIKAIVRIPKEPPVPLGKAGQATRKQRARSRGKSATAEAVYVRDANPEGGWDKATPQMGVVVDWHSGEEVQRRLCLTANKVKPQPAANHEFYFQKVFGDGEYIAAGQLLLPPGGHKPSKMTKDNTYVFYVIEGAVTFKVHESSYILCAGGMILVPRGNNYYIENIAKRDSRLFFAQARRVAADDEPAPALLPASALPGGDKDEDDEGEGGEAPRSSSAAPAVAKRKAGTPAAGKRAASTRA